MKQTAKTLIALLIIAAVSLGALWGGDLLTRTLFILTAGVLAFLGLLTMFKYLRCPHCGAFGLKQIQFCTNCGKDLDAEVVVEEVSEETAENAEAIGAPAAAEIAESSEAAEPVDENK